MALQDAYARPAVAADALPPELADALRPVLPELAEDTIAAIGRAVPAYARPMEGPFGQGVRTGVERALARFVDQLAEPGAPVDDPARAVYHQLGRGEARSGRSLDALLAAYRLGARMAWERFVGAAEAAGHEPRTLYALAGAIFTYIDAISAESVEGFAQEQSLAAGERARRRRALARALSRDDVPEAELADLAAAAGWPLPGEVAALVATGLDAGDAGRLGVDVVALADDDLLVAFVPDPLAPGRRAELAHALRGAPAALGPAVAPGRAHHSLHRARLALKTLDPGPGELVAADDHLLALLLGGDPQLAADHAAAVLAPLDALPTAAARSRMAETLAAWLDHPGQVTHVAARLHVHPQTVRYRVGRLRELLGEEALDDPDRRFALQVALRSRAR